MLEYTIKLDAREQQPLGRAFTLTRGDKDAIRLCLTFWDGDKELGTTAGDYATLALRALGAEQTQSYILTRRTVDFALQIGQSIILVPGIIQATAVLYNATDARLTVGRFCFTVREDLSLPQDDILAQEQVNLFVQAVGAIALVQDSTQQLKDNLQTLTDDALAAGTYAKEWGQAAQDIVSGAMITWDTLPGKPVEFPPAAHVHTPLSTATALPTPLTLAQRDAAGRLQCASPVLEQDVARLAEVTQAVADKASTNQRIQFTLAQSSWSGTSAPFTQTLSLSSVQDTRDALVRLKLSDIPATALAQRTAYGQLYTIAFTTNTVTATAMQQPPDCDLTLEAVFFG